MALVRTARGTGTHNTSATTFTLSPASNFAAGMAVLCIAADNAHSSGTAATTYTVTDTLGNTWTRRASALIDPGAANAGSEGAIFTTLQNGGLLTTGTTITVTYDTATTAKVWTLDEVKTDQSGQVVAYVTSGVGTSGTGTTSPTITSGSIAINDIIVGAVFIEAGTTESFTDDADSTNGSWTASQSAKIGSTTSGQAIISQTKIVTAAGAQTFNPTLGLSGDLCLGWVQIHEALAIAPALLDRTAVITAPVVTSLATIAPALLNQAAAATAPVVTSLATIIPGLLDRTATLSAPTVTSLATVAPGLLDQTAIATAPTITTGPVTVALTGVLDQTAVTTAPTVTLTTIVTVALLDQTAIPTAPTITVGAVTVDVPLLDASAASFAPTITTANSVDVALIDAAASTFAPAVTATVTLAPALIDRSAVATAPAITTTVTVSVPSLDASAVAFAPSVALRFDLPTIDASAGTFAPTVSAIYSLSPAFLDVTAATFSPAIGSLATVAPALLDQTAVVFSPDVDAGGVSPITPALLDASAAAFAPAVMAGPVFVDAPLIDRSAIPHEPSITSVAAVEPGLIDAAAMTFAPAVSTIVGISAVLIDQAAVTFTPLIGQPHVLGPASLIHSIPGALGRIGQIERIWIGDAISGVVLTTPLPVFEGLLVALNTSPGDPAPSAGYDVTIRDREGLDRLHGSGLGRSSTETESVPVFYPGVAVNPPVSLSDVLALHVDGNAIGGGTGRVVLVYSRRVGRTA